MSFLEDLSKTKKAFWLVLSLSIIFFISNLILGFLLVNSNRNYSKLKEENKRLANSSTPSPTPSPSPTASSSAKSVSPSPTTTASAASEAELLKENTDLKLANQNLQNTVNDKSTKMAKAKTYNEFFKYLNDVTEAHNGYTGWTEAEYHIARTKAEATGDGNFVTIVDTAWTATGTSVIDRMIKLWSAIDEAIGSNL